MPAALLMGVPTPNDPIVDFPSAAIVLDTILVERTSNKIGTYDPIEPGAPFLKGTHSAAQAALFEGNEFLGQKATADDEFLQRYWGTTPSTQDIANWEESFSGQTNAYPIFLRRYLEKRDTYVPRTKLTALPGLYRIEVTAAGTGYTSAPTVSFVGGTGSGGSAIAVLNNNGGIAKITLKSEGTWTVAPAVAFTGGGGAGATATAYVQAQTCVLVEEKTGKAPFPYESLYILVERLYETLPGPWLPRAIWDLLTGPKQLRQRAVINTGQASTQTGLTTTTYQARDGSAIVSWEIEETISDGSGVVSCNAASATVAAAGTGYVSGDTITLSGGTFSTAAVLTPSTFSLITANINAPGTGYTVGETYTLIGGAGTESAVAIISTLKLVSLAINAAGTGYAPADTVTLSGGTAGTKAVITVATTKLVAVVRNAKGTGYAVNDTITLAGGTFSAAAVVTLNSVCLVSLAIDSAGSGYAPGDQVTLAGGTTVFPGKASVQVQTVGGGGSITSIVMSSAGGYSVTATNFTQFSTSGAGTGATFQTPVWGVNSVSVSTPGSYTVNSTTFTQSATSGVGTGATFGSGGTAFGILTFTITTAGSYTVGSTTFTQDSTSGSGILATFQSGVFGANTVGISTAGVFTTTAATLTLGTGSGSGTGATLNSLLYSPLSATVTTPGNYSIPPTNPVSQSGTTGAGSGATWTVDLQCSQNSKYPQIEGPITYDNERGNVHSHSQLELIIWKVTSATVVSGGTGGTPGAVTITGTTGTGTKFQATGTINGSGILTGALTVTVPGTYSVAPTSILIEPVTGGSLTGTTVSLTIDAAQESSLAVTATLATLKDYEQFDQYRLKRVTTFWTLPGPLITSPSELEEDSRAPVTVMRRMKRFTDIVPAHTVVTNSLVITKAIESRIGAALGFEVTKTIGESPYRDFASSMTEEEGKPYEMPGYVDESIVDYYGTAIAYRRPVVELAQHVTHTYWLNSTSQPTVSIDPLNPDDITLNNVPYKAVLHDGFTRDYNSHSVTIPASTPSMTTFLADWVGQFKTVRYNIVNPIRFRWKIEVFQVKMTAGVLPP